MPNELGPFANWLEPYPPPPLYWMLGAILVAMVCYGLLAPYRSAAVGDNRSKARLVVPFGLSVFAGSLVLVNGFAVTLFRANRFTGPSDLSAAFIVIGFFQSLVVPAAALMLWVTPRHQASWGFVIIVFSVASLLVGGGFIVGSMLGAIGGAFAMTWTRPARDSSGLAEGTVVQPQVAQAPMPYQQPMEPTDQPERPFSGQPPP